MPNTDKREFSSIWKWIRCCNDVMTNVDCVIKRDVYPQKMYSCSKNISGISVFVSKNIRGISKKKRYTIGVIAWLFRQLKRKIYLERELGAKKKTLTLFSPHTFKYHIRSRAGYLKRIF